MSNNSNHKWVMDKTYKPEKVAYGVTTIERHHCRICGCERDTSVGYKYKNFVYSRSGIIFEHRPDCVNWGDRDALNSIDQ